MRRSVAPLLLLLLLLPVLALTSWSASALTSVYAPQHKEVGTDSCANSKVLREWLATKHGEVVGYTAINSNGRQLEIYVNPETGTWSAVVNYPPNMSCITGYGTGWKGPIKAEEGTRASAN